MIKREKSFFHLATIFTNEERKIFFFIYWLWSIRHHKERKFLFHLATTITMPWSIEKKVCFMYPLCSLMKKEKYFFSFSYYDHYVLIKRQKIFFHLGTMFTNEERKMFFFSELLQSLRHDQGRKKSFFDLATTITPPWSREKKDFFI